jgi:2-polyprenyl-6-methoxyphenol hydroxylase-like FAD-dependent oxidoreductase
MRIMVVGGSAAGQFSALLLARAGHEVVDTAGRSGNLRRTPHRHAV